jgi:small-conductance mechanosensitive channel
LPHQFIHLAAIHALLKANMRHGAHTLSWPELWTDLHNPNILWQILAITLSIGIAFGVTYAVGRLWKRESALSARSGMGFASFGPVAWPLLALAMIALAKPVLAKWQHVNLLKFALPLIGAFALIRVVFYALRRIFLRDGQAGNVLFLFERAFATIVWLGFAIYITGMWPNLVAYLDDTVIPVGRHEISLLLILQAGLAIGATLIIALWAGAVLEERLMRMENMHSSIRTVLARSARATLILFAILISLSLAGIDLTVLSVFGGALGVGIGLGLQKIVSSYISGFVILLERSLAVGDMVNVGTSYGQVTQINTRYTVVRSLDGMESVIPNEMLVSGLVQNYSLSDRRLRVATQVTVGYDTDIEELIPALVELIACIPRVCTEPAPHGLLLRFGADGLELEFGFWIQDPENGKGNLLSAVNRAIWKELQQRGVSVAYPQREVRVLNSALPARITPEAKLEQKQTA